MLNRLLKILPIAGFFIFSLNAVSQNNSPFSRYGIGDFSPQAFTINQAMGGIAAGYNTFFNINMINPASYASFYQETYRTYWERVRRDSIIIDPVTQKSTTITIIDSVKRDTLYSVIKNTSLEAGVFANISTLRNINSSITTGNGSLSYLALGFPLPKVGGISFGLLPYSNVEYNLLKNETVITGKDTLVRNTKYNGDGGIFQFYGGAAAKIKRFSIGVNVKYMFGSLNLSNVVYFPGLANSFGTRAQEFNAVRGFSFDAGVQYNHSFSNDLSLTLGAFGKPKTTLNVNQTNINDRVVVVTDELFPSLDTISSVFDTEMELTLPQELGIGFVLKREDSWLFGADFVTQQWGDYPSFLTDTEQNNSWKVAFGGEFQPNFAGSFFARNKYRAGFFYKNSNIIVNNNAVDEYGITFGLGIPVKRARGNLASSIDLAFQAGKRGSVTENIISENYFRIMLGFNLNDNSWIFKSKYY